MSRQFKANNIFNHRQLTLRQSDGKMNGVRSKKTVLQALMATQIMREKILGKFSFPIEC
jgi:hypothetical protein